jgi:alpha-tubulin suppressor-like RCC1 family protein
MVADRIWAQDLLPGAAQLGVSSRRFLSAFSHSDSDIPITALRFLILPSLVAATLACGGDQATGPGSGTVASTPGVLAVGGIGCLLSPIGAASCWGSGLTAPLGNGTTNSSATPITVSGAHTFSVLAAGEWETCGLTQNGDAWCWGNGFGGEIGNGSDTNATVPAAVSGGPYSAIAVGVGDACAIASSGQAYCWGDNTYGVFGNGTTSSVPDPTPTTVSGGLTLATISVSQTFACGVTVAGAGYCWGDNALGSLGNGTTKTSLVPVAVAGGQTWRSIFVSGGVACGLSTSGAAYCWGIGGQTVASTDPTRPALISPSLIFASIALGGDQACGVTAKGQAYCWGGNAYGERGTGGSLASTMTPMPVTGGLAFTDIAGGIWATCGRTTKGAVYCWGMEFGTSPVKTTPSPIELVGPGST